MAQPVTVEPVTQGRLTIKTTAGDIDIELWPKESPKAVRNFLQLAMEGYYEGCHFHRVVPGLCIQTGDASNTGEGGESIYEEFYFEDEFSQRLRFNRRGLIAMANTGKRNTNLSQFFITLDRADALQNKHTIFATVRGDTYFNVLKISESELQPGTERPVYPIIIKTILIEDNPFDDIVPRITAEEKRAQEKARREARKDAASRGKKKLGVKNISLMSFGEEEGQYASTSNVSAERIGSAHDALRNDPVLKSETKEVRGLPPEMPQGMGTGLSQVQHSGLKRKAQSMTEASAKAPRSLPNSMDSYAFSSLIEKHAETGREQNKKGEEQKGMGSTNVISESDRVQAEIAKVQADLKKLTRRSRESDNGIEGGLVGLDPETRGKMENRKAKENGAALLAAQRAKYTRGGRSIGKAVAGDIPAAENGRSRRRQDDGDLLDALEGFRSRVRTATTTTVGDSVGTENGRERSNDPDSIDGYAGEILEIDEDDEGWMSHTLRFRKDATMDQHNINEYEVIDPRAQNMTLEDAKHQEARLKRRIDQREGGSRLSGAATASAEQNLRDNERFGTARHRNPNQYDRNGHNGRR